MRLFLSCFLMFLLSFGLFINEASAKRFGGGRSFGVQRSYNSMFSQNKAQKAASLGQRTKNPSRWGGLLGGLLIGGLLTSLFMGHGLANGLMTWLIMGAVIFFIINFFRHKIQPAMQTNQRHAAQQNPFNQFTQAFTSSATSSGSLTNNFSPETFLREAKVTFTRLQTAYDQKNLQDLQEFTAPEVFAEIKMQLEEQGNEPNKTEVITLHAELLDVSEQTNSLMASVRFTGSIKENNDPISPLDEIWHFRQFNTNNGWVVGGIQQQDTLK